MKFKPIADITICTNKISLSIQASLHHFCSPRCDVGPYDSVEVGFIRDANGNRVAAPDSWAEYADGDAGVLSDIFAYVPVGLVEEFIESCGGRSK
jgi:hypothetical protein